MIVSLAEQSLDTFRDWHLVLEPSAPSTSTAYLCGGCAVEGGRESERETLAPASSSTSHDGVPSLRNDMGSQNNNLGPF